MMRILTDYWYRQGYKEGVFGGLKTIFPSWFIFGLAVVLLSLYWGIWSIWHTLYILAMPAFWVLAMAWATVIELIARE